MTSPQGYILSLVVPVYGVENYIACFAESALGQWCEGVQYVFVNDGTKDRSMEVLRSLVDEKYGHLWPHIAIVEQENMGLAKARRAGILRAEGEYILCADSDDWLAQGALLKVVATIGSTGADMIYFDLVKEYGHKQSIKREREYTGESRMEFIRNIYNYRSAGYTVTKCFRRNLYTDNKIYTPELSMHEDIHLMSQLIFYARTIVHLPEVLYHYRKDNPAALCAQKRSVRHLASSRNLLGLVAHYWENPKNSPVADVWGGVVLRAGWHSMIHGGELWNEFPWLAEAVRKAPLGVHYRTPLLFQLVVKLYVLVCK